MTAKDGRTLLREALAAHRAAGGWVLGERVDGPGRTPLSEAGAVGLATGLALGGARVVVELVDPGGFARAADGLADAATLPARSRGAWSAPFVVLAPLADDAALPVVPEGVPVAVAGRAGDVPVLLQAALAGGGPAVVLLSDAALDGRDGAGGAAGSERLREGDRATLLAVGAGVPVALAAAEALAAAGEAVEVIDLRGPRVDDAAAEAVARTGRAVVVGHGGEDLLGLVRRGFWRLEAEPVLVRAHAGADAVVAAVRASLEA